MSVEASEGKIQHQPYLFIYLFPGSVRLSAAGEKLSAVPLCLRANAACLQGHIGIFYQSQTGQKRESSTVQQTFLSSLEVQINLQVQSMSTSGRNFYPETWQNEKNSLTEPFSKWSTLVEEASFKLKIKLLAKNMEQIMQTQTTMWFLRMITCNSSQKQSRTNKRK